VVIAPPEGDLRAYLASLRRLQGLGLRQMLPGHGPAIDDPAALLERYIRHRQEREQQVLDGLAGGAHRVGDLVAAIYPELSPTLRVAAALSLTAHLLKLEDEGRVTRTPDPDGTDLWRIAVPGSQR
jgi:glyoxylase-like metal-dependent hydrolase (beta-lactamase superfamily II)